MKTKRIITKKQKSLAKDIEDLIQNQGLSVKQIMEEEDSDARTAILELAKDQIIRGQIIYDYALMDEALNAMIHHFFFGKKYKNKNKRTLAFDECILEQLYLLNKLELAKRTCDLPKNVNDFICALNGIRNGLAHSLMPESLQKNKPIYKGKSIYDKDGLKLYREDLDKVIDFLTEKAWGIKRSDWGS
jgi:hypothetical protein